LNKPTSLPFGLQFAENPVTNVLITSATIYDEDQDISVVIDKNGQRIPSVENYKNLGTKTFTEVQAEATDDDQNVLNVLVTATKTAATEESSDSDDNRFALILSTKTETLVAPEQTDEDPSLGIGLKPPLTTGTATKVAVEETDKD